MKKTLSIILAILMIVTMLPMAVLPAGAVSKTQDGFTVNVTYGVCKYCGDQHTIESMNIKSISVENGKVTFNFIVEFKNRGDCSKTANVKSYSGVNTSAYTFTYTITDDFSCEQSYLINESYGQDFGEDKPKLLYSISRKEGHQVSSWTFNGTKHSGTCELCGKNVNDNCSGGTATCMEKATCSTCGNKYGSLASDNHDWSNLDGICANGCGAECSHKWGDGALVRPTKTEEGYYTYTCSACGATKTEAAQRAANYAEYTKALNDLRAYLDSDKLTNDVKASVAEWLEIYDSDEAYKFIAGEEETVNLYIEAALQYATEIEAAIQDCLAGNHSGNGEYCDICGATLHTCDFSGEWNYSTEKHWKECSCGEISEEAEHTFTDGKCDCGYECNHEETYYDIIRPVQNADGTWGKGTAQLICVVCGPLTPVEEVERNHEGYKLFDETAAKLELLLGRDDIIPTPKESMSNSLRGNRNAAYSRVYTDLDFEKEMLASMTKNVNDMLVELEARIADGMYIKADFSYLVSLLNEINALVDNNPENIISSFSVIYADAVNFYKNNSNNPGYNQNAYDYYVNSSDLENQLEKLIAGLKDGSALKADYTAIDEAIAEIEEKLGDVELTDEAKAGLEEIKSQLEEMKADGNTSEADLAALEKALEEYETELDAGINDGTALKVDGFTVYTERGREWLLKFADEGVYEKASELILNSTEVQAKLDEIYDFALSLEGNVAENAENIAKIEADVDEFFGQLKKCVYGIHNVSQYKEISPAKCGENAVEEGACWFCGETVTREVENSALKHSFTKYEETEAPKCGVEGKEVAVCDNGCGATDEKAIEALEHLFLDYIYNEDATCTADGTKTAECVYGCGETDTVTAKDTMLNHADEDGDGICDDCETEIKDVCPDCGGAAHESQIGEYICMVVTLIRLVVSLLKTLGLVA